VDQGVNAASYVGPLRYLGVRNVRDGDRNGIGLIMLHQEAGALVDLLGGDVVELIAMAKSLADAGALLSIEGPNEPNNFPIRYNGQPGGAPAAGFRWPRFNEIYTMRSREIPI